MRRLAHIGAAVAAALGLAGCGTLGGGSTINGDALIRMLTDPNCAHDDEISFVTGAAGIPASLTGKAARHCPGPAARSPGSPPAMP